MNDKLASHDDLKELAARRQIDADVYELLSLVNAAGYGGMTLAKWHGMRREIMERIQELKPREPRI